MKIKHFMYLLALVLMINLNACSSDSPEEEIPEVPPQEEPGTDPNAPQGADIVVSPNTLLLKDGLDKYVDNPVEGSTLSLNAGVKHPNCRKWDASCCMEAFPTNSHWDSWAK